jgi:hypothetical protein
MASYVPEGVCRLGGEAIAGLWTMLRERRCEHAMIESKVNALQPCWRVKPGLGMHGRLNVLCQMKRASISASPL